MTGKIAGAFALATVAACGCAGRTIRAQKGFQPAPRTGGTPTVRMDSTRLAAARQFLIAGMPVGATRQ